MAAPQVGKSLLIRCLVKHYTKHSVPAVKGPLTLVAGKQRRLTFVECPNDLASMLDAAKLADLVLLLIDASLSFKMETFEFLSLLGVRLVNCCCDRAVQGMCNVQCAVSTHTTRT